MKQGQRGEIDVILLLLAIMTISAGSLFIWNNGDKSITLNTDEWECSKKEDGRTPNQYDSSKNSVPIPLENCAEYKRKTKI